MTAQEAKARAQNVVLEKDETQYDEIMLSITEKANKGEYDMYYHKMLSNAVKSRLKTDGYVVTDIPERDGNYTVKISWV
jgi:hypothetical protein